jgi:DNA polymerase-1
MFIGIDPSKMLELVRDYPGTIAYDTETNGLVWGKNVVIGYVITNKEYSLYTPVRHEGGGNIPDVESFEQALGAAFDERGRKGYRTVGHNLNFDITMGWQSGVVPRAPLEDTQINEGLIDDNTVGYSLDECAKRHGVTPKAGAELYAELARRFGGVPDRKQMANFYRMPGDDPHVVDYACGDGVTTLELWERQQVALDEQDLRRVWQLECDLIPYVAGMKIKGMKVDSNVADEVIADIERDVAEAKKILPPGFNPRSPKEVEALFRSNGFSDGDFDRSETGRFSFTEKWLQTNDIGRSMLKVRKLDNARSSFIAPLIDTHNINGRVHATLNQSRSDEFGTNTGRFSCSDPNLQAQPKRNKDIGKRVRRLVVPDEDMIIEEGDAKQQEPRLFTHYSDDENLLKGYKANPPIDIHSQASSLLGLDRDIAKRLGLGMLTGMQPPTLAKHMGYSLLEARAHHRMFLTDAFPGIGRFQRQARLVATNRGYIKTLLGRRARFPDSQYAYKATSRIIQGSGADHIKLVVLRACQYAESLAPGEIDILMTIHDSVLWQRHKSTSSEELVRIMENVANELELQVPIPFEVGSGLTWAEASYGK